MNENPIFVSIDPKKIVIDMELQSRVDTDERTVNEYVEAMLAGDRFPAIVVYYDSLRDAYFLSEGFHRLMAHLRARPNDPITVEQRFGSRSEAQWNSICSNKNHGLRRSNEDKRNAVAQALLHPKGAVMSDRSIARALGVSHPTVHEVREKLIKKGLLEKGEFRIGADGNRYKLKTIGRRKVLDATCAECLYYENDACSLADEPFPPDTLSCEDFALPAESLQEEEREMSTVAGKSGRPRRSIPLAAPRREANQGWTDVRLAAKNLLLSAVEIRDIFGTNYAAGLGKTLLDLVAQSTQCE